MQPVKTDQPGHLPRLIQVFSGHTSHFVDDHVMHWHKNIIAVHIELFKLFTLYLLVSSPDNLCKQFETRSKLFDTLMIFLKECFEYIDFKKISG